MTNNYRILSCAHAITDEYEIYLSCAHAIRVICQRLQRTDFGNGVCSICFGFGRTNRANTGG